ncbi:anti-sigma factor [Algiphilus sp.]|uniref:anti-sigma factor n=1 Tax=Algiphilus sp. TaxID=1872431 RepID=UPI001CA6B94C|nr:anti-sigma factor [Algiphilus sp.]MBY8964114.1 anti-sigma factor [Algiphilus acroporae]MCI5062279.1 anti-sigma factor [Algiphilus sp.]MCI5104601.1 anti-sigma factor [Algiphilus sp.]MCR9090441.1 anti-sigma factor [Pseudomonadota bacterium]
MNALDPQTRSLLAAEYVLGTLQGPARRRFDRWLQDSEALQRDVAQWEAHLHQVMTRSLQPVTPPDAIRQRIMARIGAQGALSSGGIMSSARTTTPGGRRRRQRRMGGLAAAAAVMLAVIAFFLPERVHQPEPPVVAEPTPSPIQPLKELAIADGARRWTVGLRDGQPVIAAAEGLQPPPPNTDYELWWIGDGAPVSLGVLPHSGARPVTVPAEAAGLDTGALAISREPEGGAPEGTPGEVLEVFPLES